MIEGHGNDRYNYGDRIKIDFSSNIAFNNKSSLIIEYMSKHLAAIKNYPDPSARVLSEKIATHHAVAKDNILVVNGSAEAFYMVAHLLSSSKSKTLIFTPSFAEYEDSCKVYGHNIDFIGIEQYHKVDYSRYSNVWIGTPNNPNGFRVTIKEIANLAKKHSDTCFVVDRAYNDLSSSKDEAAMGTLAPNIILINSLTKSFGIPGIRLGYVIANEEFIKKIQNLRAPWSVNALSLVVGEYVMDNYDSLYVDIDELLAESSYLQTEISNIEGIEVIESDCNFFLCKIQKDCKAEELHSYLVQKHGILIRNASNFRGLTDRHFRIAAQTRQENIQLIKALREWTTTF